MDLYSKNVLKVEQVLKYPYIIWTAVNTHFYISMITASRIMMYIKFKGTGCNSSDVCENIHVFNHWTEIENIICTLERLFFKFTYNSHQAEEGFIVKPM